MKRLPTINIELSNTNIDDLTYWLNYALDLQTDPDNRSEIIDLLATIEKQWRPTPWQVLSLIMRG